MSTDILNTSVSDCYFHKGLFRAFMYPASKYLKYQTRYFGRRGAVIKINSTRDHDMMNDEVLRSFETFTRAKLSVTTTNYRNEPKLLHQLITPCFSASSGKFRFRQVVCLTS